MYFSNQTPNGHRDLTVEEAEAKRDSLCWKCISIRKTLEKKGLSEDSLPFFNDLEAIEKQITSLSVFIYTGVHINTWTARTKINDKEVQ